MDNVCYPWQVSQWQHLTQRIEQQNFPHSLLIYGIEGTGKCHFAKQLAKRLLCTQTKGQQSCGHCRSCHLFQQAHHPDFYQLRIDGTSQLIKVDAIRELITFTQKTSQLNGGRVVLIEAADHMSRGAANALLKTLEEPGEQMVFLLIADSLSQLPATVLSRCQRTHMMAKVDDNTCRWLQQQIADPTLAALLLSLAHGAPLKAIKMSKNDTIAYRHKLIEAIISLKNHTTHVVNIANDFQKLDVKSLLEQGVILFSDIIRYKQTQNVNRVISQDLLKEIQQICGMYCIEQLYLLIDIFSQSEQILQGHSHPNMQLLLENLISHLYVQEDHAYGEGH